MVVKQKQSGMIANARGASIGNLAVRGHQCTTLYLIYLLTTRSSPSCKRKQYYAMLDNVVLLHADSRLTSISGDYSIISLMQGNNENRYLSCVLSPGISIKAIVCIVDY